MSHFSVLVFTTDDRDIERQLAPYEENLATAPYIKYTRKQAIAKTRKEIEEYKNGLYAEYLANVEAYEEKYKDKVEHLKYLRTEFPKKLKWTDEQCYEEVAKYWESEMIDEDGNLWSRYNPHAKWDWYDDDGGRWKNRIVTKSGENVNQCLSGELDLSHAPFAFIDTMGRWHEKGEMGWWAMVSNKKTEDEWMEEFRECVERMGENVEVTMVDCHI